MGNIFRWDSPFAQKIAMVGNLVILNILWIICSLPIITMGAATTAMYYTVFQYQTNDEDEVFRPFFRAFGKNFLQSTLLWLPILAVGALMTFNVRYLFAYGGSNLLWIVIFIVSIIYLMLQPQLLPQIARFETKLGTVIQNAALLTILHMPSAFLMATLNVLPIVLFFAKPVMFMRCLPLWVCIWFSLVAFMNGRMLLKIWNKHMPAEEETQIQEEIQEQKEE